MSIRARAAPMMRFTATMTTSITTTPIAEYNNVSNFFCFIFEEKFELARSQIAQNDASRKQREDHHREKENQVARIDDAALESDEVRHHAEGRHEIHEPFGRVQDVAHEIRHRLPACHDEQETNHDGKN